MTADAVVLQIVRGALTATLKEMEMVIERTAMSPVIREKADHFVGIYDRQGRIVDAHIGMSGARMVDPVLEHFPIEMMEQGDVYWYNDPHRSHGAIQHNGDMCFVSPLFVDGEIIRLRNCFRPLLGHRRDGARQPLAARHGDLPRGHPGPAYPDHPRR